MMQAYYGVSDQRTKDIYNILHDSDIDVYFPAQHKGECTSPYVVIMGAGSNRITDRSSYQVNYELLLYVPIKNYSSIDELEQKVVAAMKQLYPMFVPQYANISDYVDDDIKAHMRILQYRNNRFIDSI